MFSLEWCERKARRLELLPKEPFEEVGRSTWPSQHILCSVINSSVEGILGRVPDIRSTYHIHSTADTSTVNSGDHGFVALITNDMSVRGENRLHTFSNQLNVSCKSSATRRRAKAKRAASFECASAKIDGISVKSMPEENGPKRGIQTSRKDFALCRKHNNAG
ncbi:hypothetical protein T265_11472 [Opisthorchis viverrini]|uniref:Uncharacterized protein n=1 Tax=Opisthorchis viverrini TaxID=6198 RepID=A0A074Z2U6_OPIVI|nr:hypothetical protein T265_11472 [Opisthorchis viverrini]KER19842.1 hypothetical protein T265_11472 [Opisthorchis viverrini]